MPNSATSTDGGHSTDDQPVVGGATMAGAAEEALEASKSSIAKEKLCDEEFDKLVLDTSFRVSQREVSTKVESSNNDHLRRASPGSGSNSSICETRADEEHSSASEKKSLSESSNQTCHDDSLANEQYTSASATTYNRLNQPKRPMNAFMVWGQAIRRDLHLRFSNVQNALLSKALGRVWRSLDSAQKEPYVRKANLIKANHKRDYPDYRYQPRRIQERRSKSNLLIGISLKHPVNEHPRCRVVKSGCVGGELNQTEYVYLGSQRSCSGKPGSLPAQAVSCGNNHAQQPQAQPQHHQLATGYNGGPCSAGNGNRNQDLLVNQMVLQEGKEMDGVQTFEYHPYPQTTPSGSSMATSRLDPASFNELVCGQQARNGSDYAIAPMNHLAHPTTSTTSHPNSNSSQLTAYHAANHQRPLLGLDFDKQPYQQHQLPPPQTNYAQSVYHHQPTQFTYGSNQQDNNNSYFFESHQQQHQTQIPYQEGFALKAINGSLNNYYEINSIANTSE